jgi:hypothetical protein
VILSARPAVASPAGLSTGQAVLFVFWRTRHR